MNQYVVDRPEQASGFGAYSLTYIGSDLVGQDADENTPGPLVDPLLQLEPGGARLRRRARRPGRAGRDGPGDRRRHPHGHDERRRRPHHPHHAPAWATPAT